MLYDHSETCLVSVLMTETTEAILICVRPCERLTFETKGWARVFSSQLRPLRFCKPRWP